MKTTLFSTTVIISKLKHRCLEEHRKGCLRNLRDTHYVYFCSDSYTCFLASKLIAFACLSLSSSLHGRKELITIKDGYQELESKLWAEFINQLLIIV
ncbi:MAG: hypothetical protein ACTS78_04515 [Arsenophonus sp. NC-WZS1-MAG3]